MLHAAGTVAFRRCGRQVRRLDLATTSGAARALAGGGGRPTAREPGHRDYGWSSTIRDLGSFSYRFQLSSWR